MFCESCGKQIPEDSRFCEFCGAPVKQEPSTSGDLPQQSEVIHQIPEAPNPPRAPMSFKTKLLLGVVAGVVVLGVAAKMILGMAFSPERTVNQFLDAVRAQDAAGVKRCAVADSDQLELNEQTLAPFFAMYSQDESALTMWQQELTNQATLLESGSSFPLVDDTVKLVKKSYLLFSTYQVQIQSAQVSMESEFEGVVVQLSDTDQILPADGVQSVNVLPGLYHCQVTYTSPETGITLTDEQQYTFYSGQGQSNYAYLDYCSVTLYPDDGVEITGVEIDGVEYTGALGDEITLQPLNTESQVLIHANAFGLEFEKTLVAGDDSWVTVKYTMSEEEQLKYQELAQTAVVQIMKTALNGDQASLDALKKDYPNSDWTDLEEQKNSLSDTGIFSYRSGVEISQLTVTEVTDFDYRSYTSYYGDEESYLRVSVYMDLEISGTYYSNFGKKENSKTLEKQATDAKVVFRVNESGVSVDSYSFDRYY